MSRKKRKLKFRKRKVEFEDVELASLDLSDLKKEQILDLETWLRRLLTPIDDPDLPEERRVELMQLKIDDLMGAGGICRTMQCGDMIQLIRESINLAVERFDGQLD